MKEFSCSAVVPDCSASIQGESEEEVLEKAAVHAREAHGMDTLPPEVVDQVKANIQETA